MGTIDSATVTISCPSCDVTETTRVLDRGNQWSGSAWQTPRFEKFDTSVDGLDKAHFELTATCPRCNVPARVDDQFGK